MGRQDALTAYANNVKRRRWRAAQRSPLMLFAAGAQGGWWDPSDLSTLFQDSAGTTRVTDDGHPVGRVLDKSGRGNHLLVVGAAGTRPLYKTSGGLHWLEFDGADDRLRALFTITQPFERISGLRQLTWTVGDRLIGGGNAGAGEVQQSGVTTGIAIVSGAVLSGLAPALGANFVLTERHSGATSRMALNNGAYVTGNAGTTACGGITLGSFHSGAAWGHVRFYGAIMRAGAMDVDQIDAAREWVASKTGVLI